jgi:hypothetical protein
LTIKFPNGCPRPYLVGKLALTPFRLRWLRASLRLPRDCRPSWKFHFFPDSHRTCFKLLRTHPSSLSPSLLLQSVDPKNGRPCSLLPVILQLSKISPARASRFRIALPVPRSKSSLEQEKSYLSKQVLVSSARRFFVVRIRRLR